MKHLYLIIVLFLPLFHSAQDAGDIILSGKSTVLHLPNYAPKTAAGIDYEFFIAKRFSVRGGYIQGPEFIKITPSPVFWSLMYLGAGKGRGSAACGDACFSTDPRIIVALLGLSDGFAYYIPVGEKCYITPYLAPLQWVMVRNNPKNNFASTLLSAGGVGFKYINDNNLSFDVSAEYNCNTFSKSLKTGFSVNFAVGYRFGGSFDH